MNDNRDNAAPKNLRVEVWADLICPWCGIGETNFARALDMFEHRDEVETLFRSYRLMPGKPPGSIEALLAERYELSDEEIVAGLKKLEDAAAAVGLRYCLAGSRVGDTMDGHRLVKLAQQSGKGQALFHRLFTACMSEQARFHDPAVLLRLAEEAGLERGAIAETLDSDAYRDIVLAEEAAMKDYGGRAVPFFVINEQYTYSGALSPETFLDALRKARQESAAAQRAGAGCGPDGCPM